MTPDRLRGWLSIKPAGAQRVQIACDQLTGLTVVADWERAELDEDPTGAAEAIAQSMIQQAQEFTDAEGDAQKFLVRWIGTHDRPIKTVTHRTKPSTGDEEPIASTHVSDPIVRDLLKHLDSAYKQMHQYAATNAQATERTLALVLGQLEASIKRERERPEPIAAAELVLSEEQREESLQRARAFEKLNGVLPDVIRLAIAAASQHLLPPENGLDTTATGDHDA